MLVAKFKSILHPRQLTRLLGGLEYGDRIRWTEYGDEYGDSLNTVTNTVTIYSLNVPCRITVTVLDYGDRITVTDRITVGLR